MILIIEDEKNISNLLKLELTHANYECDQAFDGESGLNKALNQDYELILLDLMLPRINGIEVCRQLRLKKQTPIIMLTAKETEIDKITGLTMGADDYVTKPFRPLELMARIKAQLRRYTMMSPKKDESVLTIGALTIDKDNHRCFLDNQLLSLTPTEFSILWLLCSNQGKVVSVDQIFHDLWGEKYYTNSSSSIMVHIRHLREKMNDSAENPRYIQTVWGVGYKIE